MPAIDRGIELHAGIAALPGGFGDLASSGRAPDTRSFFSPVCTDFVHHSRSSTTASMNSSVARTELLAFWKKIEL